MYFRTWSVLLLLMSPIKYLPFFWDRLSIYINVNLISVEKVNFIHGKKNNKEKMYDLRY